MSRFFRAQPSYFILHNSVFSPKKSARFLSIMAQLLHFRVKAVFLAGHFVIIAFVFMHIAGSISIFNISKGDEVLPRILLP